MSWYVNFCSNWAIVCKATEKQKREEHIQTEIFNFEYINKKSQEFISDQQPVISVDCKKKELVGNYKNE
jgi:hypothetical protein